MEFRFSADTANSWTLRFCKALSYRRFSETAYSDSEEVVEFELKQFRTQLFWLSTLLASVIITAAWSGHTSANK